MSRLMPALLFSATFVASFVATLPAYAADLTIHVDGVASAEGEIKVAIYNSADTFLSKPLRGVAAPAHAGAVDLKVSGLPAGDYALAIYHDANANDKMDRNLVGLPTEDYAFSNNALAKRGPPRFGDARIALPESGATTTVNLR